MNRVYHTLGRSVLLLSILATTFSQVSAGHFSTYFPNATEAGARTTEVRTLGAIPFLADVYASRTHTTSRNQAVVVCFDNFTAGDDVSYCEGETATLDGGFDTYNGGGSYSIIWTRIQGGGNLSYNNFPQPPQSGMSVFESNNNFSSLNPVTYDPVPGERIARFELSFLSSDATCEEQKDTVIVYFDPKPQPLLTITADGAQQGIALPGGATAAATVCSGTEVSFIVPNAPFDNAQETGFPVYYEVAVTDAGGVLPAGTGAITDEFSAANFDANFSGLTLNNTSGSSQVVGVEIVAYYESTTATPNNDAGECSGDTVSYNVTVLNAAQATFGITGNGNPNFCEGDLAPIRLTGTVNTTVTYRIDTVGGAMGTEETIDINGTGIADTTVITDDLAGTSLDFVLVSVEYQGMPNCPQPAVGSQSINVLPRPDGEFELINLNDSLFCFAAGTKSISLRLATDRASDYIVNFHVEDESGDISGPLTDTVTTATSIFSPVTALGSLSDPISVPSNVNGGQSYVIVLDSLRDTLQIPNCAAVIADSLVVTQESDVYIGYEITAGTQTPVALDPTNGTATINVCDATQLTIALDSVNISRDGAQLRALIAISDANDQLGIGGMTLDTIPTALVLSELMDIINSATTDESIFVQVTPYFDNDNSGDFSGDDCDQTSLDLDIIIKARPFANLNVVPLMDTLVCEGESVDLEITGPANGSVVLGIGNQGLTETIMLDGTGVATRSTVIDSATLFTLISVTNPVSAGSCSNIINRQLTIRTEDVPTASIALVQDTVCFADGTMLSVDITGMADSFTFEIDSAGLGTITYTVTGDTTIAINAPDASGVFALTSLINAGSLRSCADTTMTLIADTLVVEDSASVQVVLSFFDSPEQIELNPSLGLFMDTDTVCSGDTLLFDDADLLAISPDASSQTGDSLYVKFDLVDPIGAFPGLSASQIVKVTNGDLAADLNNAALDNGLALAAKIEFTFTPFYFDDSNGAPTMADFATACTGTVISSEVVVRPVPRITFGGNTTICEGASSILTFTGLPNGSITVSSMSVDPGFPMGFVSGDQLTLDNTGFVSITVNPSENAMYSIGNITDGSAQMCTSSTSLDVNVTVVPTPDVQFAYVTVDTCAGTPAVFELEAGPAGALVYYHTEAMNGGAVLETSTVTLDGSGEFRGNTIVGIDSTTVIVLDSISTQSPIVCTATLGDMSTVNAQQAPSGTLTSNGPVCVGEEVMLTFNDQLGADYVGEYTLVINGNTYMDVSDGDTFAAEDTVSTYNLMSMVQQTADMCSDTITGNIFVLPVVIETVPDVTLNLEIDGTPNAVTAAATFTDTVCSGTPFDIDVMGTPLASSTGDDLWYEVSITDDDNVLGNGSFTINVPAIGVNALIDANINSPVVYNGPNSSATIEGFFVPYYEANPGSPTGPTGSDACPGDTLDFKVGVLPQLAIPTVTAPSSVCFGDPIQLTFAGGTPGSRVTFFYGGLTDFVDIDGAGAATSQMITLSANTDFFITGISTLPPAAICTRVLNPMSPDASVVVTPLPMVMSAGFAADTICTDVNYNFDVVGTPNASVFYSMNGTPVTTPLVLDGNGDGTITNTGMAPGMSATTTIIALTSIATNTMPVCTTILDSTVLIDTVNVMPIPTGTLTVAGPVCSGGSVDIIFTATSTPVRDSFRIRVRDAAGNLVNPIVSVVASGDVAYTVNQPGMYYLERVRDNFGDGSAQGNSCLNISGGVMGDALDSVLVIIEDEPQLSATAQGTSGVITLNNQSFINVFTTAVCSGDDLIVPFSTSTATSQAGPNPLYVEVQATDAAGLLPQILPAAAGMGNNFVLPIGSLDFNGTLNNTSTANQVLNLTITPYFEDGTDATTLSMDECAGRPLNFNITVLPEIVVAVDSMQSDFEICANESIDVTIDGPAGAVVYYTAVNAMNQSPSPVTLDANGEFNIVGMPTLIADTVLIVLDSAQLTTTVSGQARLCKVVLDDTLKVAVNALPAGFLSYDPAGPICNGETADLVFNANADGVYNLVLNSGTMVGPLTVTSGTAIISDDVAYTMTTTDTLVSVTNAAGCTVVFNTTATLQVEAVPTVNIEVVAPVSPTTVNVTNGETQNLSICTGDSFAGIAISSTTPLVSGGANWLEVTVTGTNFFGTPTTSFIPVADFNSDYMANLFNVGNTPLTITLTITPYIETAPGAMATRSMAECAGEALVINLTVNPSPVTMDITAETCSDVQNIIDLNTAVTNGVTGVDYTYTVVSSDPAVITPEAACTTGCGTTIETVYNNTSSSDVDITYTVSTSVGGCAGSSFLLTYTIQPEGILDTTAFNGVAVCSGEAIDEELATTNSLTDSFRLIAVDFVSSPDFIGSGTNTALGTINNEDLIINDEYTNLTPDTVTVTYSVAPIGANGCIGDTLDFTVDIYPEPKVADQIIEICSGTRLDIDVLQELVANQIGTDVTFVRRKNVGSTLIVLDGNNNDTQECDPAGDCGGLFGAVSFDQNNFINDSIINTGTATVSLFYDIIIEDDDNDCADGSTVFIDTGFGGFNVTGNTFTLEVRVREEADIEFTNTGVTEFCSGSPITLGTNFTNGGGQATYVYTVDAQDAGVTNIVLTPSSTGSSVSIDGNGSGMATIRVTATDNFGCFATETIDVTVGNTPAPQMIQGSDSPCAGSPVPSPYSVTPTAGNTYQWSLAAQGNNFFFGGITNAPNVSISWNSAGGPNILTCVETSPSGCSTTHTLSINVVSTPSADFSFTVDPVNNLSVAFFEAAQGDVINYSWDFGDNVGTSTDENPAYTYAAAGTYMVTLSINSLCGGVLQQDMITKPVTVGGGATCQTLNFTTGTNFFSLNVLPFDSDIQNVFGAFPEIVQVNGWENNTPTLFLPNGGGFNSLTDFTRGFGYIASVNAPVSVQVCGTAEDGTYRRPLDQGINYVGSSSTTAINADTYFATLVTNGDLQVAYSLTSSGFETYFPNGGGFNTLTSIEPGIGYVIVTNNAVGGNSYRTAGSEEHEFVFGVISGNDFVTDEPVEVINQFGEVIATINADENGVYSATPILGAYSRVDGTFAEGLNYNEAYYFRHNGITVDAGQSFNGSYRATRLDLSFNATGSEFTDPALTISPNPVVNEAAIKLQVVESGAYTISVHDVTGRTVSTIVAEVRLDAGDHTYTLNAERMPSGVYTVLVTKDGSLLPALTQRIIK